jgi:hypothetical protein
VTYNGGTVTPRRNMSTGYRDGMGINWVIKKWWVENSKEKLHGR